MNYRKLGATGLTVSEVGMGCNRLGESDRPDDHWISLVRGAVELGVNIFDSSESYGWGRSEEMLGRALEGNRDVLVATKISRIRETNAKDFSAARVISQCEESLRRLRRDVIDVYQLHSPNREDMERFDWADGLRTLLEQGKIRVAAVAVNSPADGVYLIEQGFVQVLQITYNIFEPQAEEQLFSLAEKRGVGLLCRLPLAQGILTGKFHTGREVAQGHRARMAGDKMTRLIEQADGLRPVGAGYEGGMTRMAHHFSLTPSAVSAIIPGARTMHQLAENVASSNGGGLVPGVREEIDRIRAGWRG